MTIKVRELLDAKKDVREKIALVSHLRPTGLNGYNTLQIKHEDAESIANVLDGYLDMIDALLDSAEVSI